MDSIQDYITQTRMDIQEIKTTSQVALSQILGQISLIKVSSSHAYLLKFSPTPFQQPYYSTFLPKESVNKPKWKNKDGEKSSTVGVQHDEDIETTKDMARLARLKVIAVVLIKIKSFSISWMLSMGSANTNIMNSFKNLPRVLIT